MNNCYYVIYYMGKKHLMFRDKDEFQKRFSLLTKVNFDIRFYNRSNKNKKFNINGYNFRCYKYLKDIKNEIEFDRPYKYESTEKRRRNKKSYNNIIYAFDIETSTYQVDERKLSLMYLAGLKGIECKPQEITTENYNNYTTDYIVMRSYDDVDNELYKLNKYSKKKNIITLIYIHNFSYEFSFFQNLKFIKEYFDNNNLMAIDTRQPFKLLCDNIEFRCSYKLTGLSLQNIGKNLGLEKLVDEKEYTVKFTPNSKLPDNEYIYNERDVDITLLAVLNQLKTSSAFKTTNDINTLLTVTGLTRAENKTLSSQSTMRNYSIFCKKQTDLYNKDLQNGRKVYQFLQDGFLGGYVRANRYCLFKTYKNVGSIDIASSYPTQMLNRYYPYDFKICKENLLQNLIDFINTNNNYIKEKSKSNDIKFKKDNDLLNWFFRTREISFKYFFIAEIELINVKVKSFKNKNEVPLISYHKTINNKSNVNDSYFEVDNGRIIKSHYLRMTVTNIDLFLISLFYDFEIKNCKALIYTDKCQRLNTYVRNSIKFYAEQKVKFKEMVKNTKKNIFPTKEDFYSERLKKYILNENEIDVFLTMNNKTKIIYLEKCLALSKSRLNAQYGINVQKIIPLEINYNLETNEWFKVEGKYRTPRTLLRNYSDGVFIVAFARLHLMIMTYDIIQNTYSTILYWDTDSIKFVNDTENVLKEVDYFNKQLDRKWFVSKKFNLGVFDFEGIYDNFMTAGSKSYITSKGKKIKMTVSGVPYKANEWYQRQFKREHYNFSKLCYKYFHPNTIITSDVSNKLAMGYYLKEDNYFDCEVKDEQDNSYNFRGYSGTILDSSDFTLYGITSVNDIFKFIRMTKLIGYRPNATKKIIGKVLTTDVKLKSEWAIDKEIL